MNAYLYVIPEILHYSTTPPITILNYSITPPIEIRSRHTIRLVYHAVTFCSQTPHLVHKHLIKDDPSGQGVEMTTPSQNDSCLPLK